MITSLRTEYSETILNLENSLKENEELKKVKEKQSIEIRQYTSELE